MLQRLGQTSAARFAPRTAVRTKYVAPGARSSVPKRVRTKLRTGDVRPAIYYKFDQTVQLSDGSTVERRSVFPRLEWKYVSDQRNAPLWNPSQPDLKSIERDASGRLARFKKRLQGTAAPEMGAEAAVEEDEFDLDDLVSAGAEQVTTGRLHQAIKRKKK